MDVAQITRPTEYKAGLPEDFSGRNEDATRWLLAMKAYFVINEKVYTEDATTVLIFLNKLSKGRGATFAEGWYMKLANPAIPESEKTFKKLCKSFEEAFVPKDLKDRARQTVYSLSMDKFKGDFDEYSTAFKLAQARCGVDDDSILVDALQRGVTQQLAVMMTAAALPDGQTTWKWEQWLDKAGEFYRNVVRLRGLRGGGNSYIPPARRTSLVDPNAMDIDKINLSPSDKAEHIRNRKCFICHKEGCHSSKHRGYPGKRGRGKPPGDRSSWRKTTETTKEVKTNPEVANFMKLHNISAGHAIELMGNYYSHNDAAITWEPTAEEESVELINLDF